MDYSQFRQVSSTGSAVSVNHKALIKRALTKYPVDFALFRELLQNSADAQANSATIQFETPSSDESVSQIHGLPINRLTFSNDGLDFTVDDWSRLREIASGNPNETKIGAFGVGFYSVFELTEVPLVHSGNQIMDFRYQGVQLHYNFTEKAPCYQKGSLIDLPYKNEGRLPDLVKFIGFLVQSFLLLNLNEISLQLKYVNGNIVSLLSLNKGSGDASKLDPPLDCQLRSPQKMLKLQRIQSTPLSITLKYLNVTQMPPLSMSKGFFSFGKQLVSSLVTSSGNPADQTIVNFNLKKVDAILDVSVSTNYRNHMVETLLKPPPKEAVMSLLSFDGLSQSQDISTQLQAYIFPREYNDAKIFIGFPTKQSTGLRSHLALNQVIPTMERTAVDMSNQFVKDWNCEMLYMAGLMSRCAYESELRSCQSRLDYKGDAEFIVSRFKFSDSAPDPLIGFYIRGGFWKCSKTTLVPSTQGILFNSQVRVAHGARNILRTTPLVLDSDLGNDLVRMDLVQKITLKEIAADVGRSPLTLEQAQKYAQWLAPKWTSLSATLQILLLSAFTVVLPSGKQYVLSPPLIYCDRSKLPDTEVSENLPPKCLPHDVATQIGLSELSSLGLRPLSLEEWAKFRFSHLEKKSSVDATNLVSGVLQVSCKTWSRLPNKSRNALRTLFESLPCVPTQNGLVRPSEAYIKEIKIFPHLPVVDSKLELPVSWLKEIGVRVSIDMAFVLTALNGSKLRWTNEDLLSYLDENSSSLKSSDWEVLKNGHFFSKESGGSTLYQAHQLYAPDDSLRKLGLPILSFNGWNKSSKTSQLMFALGLRKYPRPEEFMMNLKTKAACQIALRYFVRNYEEAGYNHKQIRDFQIIPTSSEDHELATPLNCYRDVEMKAFGEQVIDPQWEPAAARLGIRKHPKISDLVDRVLSDPPTYLSETTKCETILAYFAKNTESLGDRELRAFRSSSFIPIRQATGSVSWEKPASVFLPQSEKQADEIENLRPLLKTIHLAKKTYPFFYLLGISDRPTLIQLLELVLKQPASSFELLKDGDVYEELLAKFESKLGQIAQRPDLIALMKTTPFLLGVKYVKPEESEGAATKGQVSLYSASQLAVVDDISIFNHFREKIITAPQVEELERFYLNIGVPRLSQLLQESIKIGSPVVNETKRAEFQQRITERVRLFQDHTSKQVNPKYKPIEVALVSSLELNRKLYNLSSVSTSVAAYIHPNHPNQLLIVPCQEYDWIDAASALSKLVLLKPDQDSVVVLEIQLSSSLQSLERKGYNVERIRREQGLAHLEKKKPTLTFHDDEQPSRSRVVDRPTPNGNSSQQGSRAPMMQNTSHRAPQNTSLGVQRQNTSQKSLFNDLSNIRAPANSGHSNSQTSRPTFFDKLHQQFKGMLPKPDAQLDARSVDSRDQLNLGLQKAKPFSGSDLSAPQHVDAPAPVNESECTSPRKIHELQYHSSTESGIKVYTTSSHPKPLQDELLLSEALMVLCNIFNYPVFAVHLYRDEDASSIAFNFNGSLFFNTCVQPFTQSLLDYYYPVMAHELAHNLVSSHGASHSYYSESYIQSTLNKYATVI